MPDQALKLVPRTDRREPTTGQGFLYVMMAIAQTGKAVQMRINGGPRPHATMKVYLACMLYLDPDHENEIRARAEELAEIAMVPTREVYRAMSLLERYGILIKVRHGRYRANPHINWKGSLDRRLFTAESIQPWSVIEGGASPS